MKISIITSYTDPETRMDPWKESVACYEKLADEVIVLGENFKKEFAFSDFGPMFDDGFNKASGDWVIKMDIDTIIHEKDFDSLYASMKTYKDYPALSMRKFQFFTPYRFHTKSRMGMVLNKKRFKNVKFNGGGDGCDPTVNGIHIDEKNVPRVKIPFWNYDSTFKTKEVISEDRARFARAWHRTFGDYGNRGGPDPEVAFDAWYKMVNERFSKHVFKASISDHPIFIQSKLKSLNENHFGFNLFGLNEKVKRSPLNYFDAIQERYLSEFKLLLNSHTKIDQFKVD